MARHERDYIDRTIATVRQHTDATSWWVEAAQALADEVEDCRERVTYLREAIEHVIADSPGTPETVKGYLRDALRGPGS